MEEEWPLVTTVPRGGVFSLTRLERCGDKTAWEEDETSYAETFLMERVRERKNKRLFVFSKPI